MWTRARAPSFAVTSRKTEVVAYDPGGSVHVFQKVAEWWGSHVSAGRGFFCTFVTTMICSLTSEFSWRQGHLQLCEIGRAINRTVYREYCHLRTRSARIPAADLVRRRVVFVLLVACCCVLSSRVVSCRVLSCRVVQSAK